MPGIDVIGCTTAGEITSDGYRENTIAGVSFGRADYKAVIRLITDLDRFRMETRQPGGPRAFGRSWSSRR